MQSINRECFDFQTATWKNKANESTYLPEYYTPEGIVVPPNKKNKNMHKQIFEKGA